MHGEYLAIAHWTALYNGSPHMHGEYARGITQGHRGTGSPLHAWGIRIRSASASVYPRFTPTCVGNTGYATHVLTMQAVHPHMRGEYIFLRDGGFNDAGSPPHAWGIPNTLQYVCLLNRFTPTCVGNTTRLSFEAAIWSVHPHMRGEYYRVFFATFGNSGSPPHAWGILRNRSAKRQSIRFTPTCVGNTQA